MKIFLNVCGCCLKSDVPLTERFYEPQLEEINNCRFVDIIQQIFLEMKLDKNLCCNLCDQCRSMVKQSFVLKQLLMKNQQVYQQYFKKLKIRNFSGIHNLKLSVIVDSGKNEKYVSEEEFMEEFDYDEEEYTNEMESEGMVKQNGEEIRTFLPFSKALIAEHFSDDSENEEERTSNVPKETANIDFSNVQDEEQECYMCHCCDILFANVEALKKHLKFSTNVAKKINHKCNICEKTFTSNENLREHERTHLVRYSCNVCQETFAQPSELKTHQDNKHDGQRKCVICNRLFTNLIHLKDHLLLHARNRPPSTFPRMYSCRLCGETFPSAVTLTAHQNSSHPPGNPYKCKSCNMTTMSIESLNEHMLDHLVAFKPVFLKKMQTFKVLSEVLAKRRKTTAYTNEKEKVESQRC